jgi:hypothetical protein
MVGVAQRIFLAFQSWSGAHPFEPCHIDMGIFPDDDEQGTFSKKVGSKLNRFNMGEKEVPTEGEPLQPRFDRGEPCQKPNLYKPHTRINPSIIGFQVCCDNQGNIT